MKQSQTVAHACQVLRRRVRFKTAHLSLPDSGFMANDTPAIREATKIFIENWVIPIIDGIESGDTKFLKEFCEHERGEKAEDTT